MAVPPFQLTLTPYPGILRIIGVPNALRPLTSSQCFSLITTCCSTSTLYSRTWTSITLSGLVIRFDERGAECNLRPIRLGILETYDRGRGEKVVLGQLVVSPGSIGIDDGAQERGSVDGTRGGDKNDSGRRGGAECKIIGQGINGSGEQHQGSR